MLRALEAGGAALGGSGPLQELLAGAACAARSTYLTAQGAAPVQMVFGRDMALPAGFGAGWGEAAKRKQERASGSCRERARERLSMPTRKEIRY